ncbi:MAG: methyltransferase domain-containing protein [Deltaproteobacteria bacterium]|nr:MAG: methyltransferase domain-containing protein [Deltaproteobacteria bacterium]
MDQERFFQVLRGYWESAILFTAVKLGIFDLLSKEELSSEEVAKKLSLDPRGAEILLNALTSLGFLTKKKGRFSPSAFTRKHLTGRGGDSWTGFVLHNMDMWGSWGDLPYVVRKGKPRKGFATLNYRTGRDSLRNFALAMHQGGTRGGKEVARLLEGMRADSILDVGGCTGRYALFAKRVTGAGKATVLDLPEMVRVAKRIIRETAPDEARELRFLEGDFFSVSLPPEYDLVIVSNILHSLDTSSCVDLLKKCRSWMKKGGTCIVHDLYVAPSGVTPERASLFAVNMLVNTEKGRVYSEREMVTMARDAGFRSIRRKKTSSGNLVLFCS